MRVVTINGQNHKGSTYHIGRMLAEKLCDGDEIEEIFLPRDFPYFCTGCSQCFLKSETLCPHYEALKPLVKKLDRAQVMIFTTPVYVYHATGSMKAFLDHFGYRWMIHRPEESMFHKQAVCLSTAAGAGMSKANKDIKDSLDFWGVAKTYCWGIAVAATNWQSVSEQKRQKIERAVAVLERKIRAQEGRVEPSPKTKAMFYLFRSFAKRPGWNQADADYWKQKGWTDKVRPWNHKS